MGSDSNYQAFQRSGATGKTRSITPPTTAEKAREAAQAKRQTLRRGSSDSIEVRQPKRKNK